MIEFENVPTSKVCCLCHEAKPLAEFHPSASHSSGRVSRCKPCDKAYLKAWRARRRTQLQGQFAADKKHCTRCQQAKAASEFNKDAARKGGLGAYCTVCRSQHHAEWREKRQQEVGALHRERLRAAQVKHAYSLTSEQLAALVTQQQGVCAICGLPEVTNQRGRARGLCVDHCHVTGAVRGLLCNLCNQGLGRFRDDPALLEAAAAYLRHHTKAT